MNSQEIGPVEALERLSNTIAELRAEHKKWKSWDGFLYNGGTVLVLFCTTASTFIHPAEAGPMYWMPKVLLGVASFWIALDRAKAYGQRWRFHIERENQYGVLADLIKIFPAWPADQRDAKFVDLVNEFRNLRSGEANVPGTGITEGLPTPK